MKKFDYFRAVALRNWLMFTEHLAEIIMYTPLDDSLVLEKDLKYGTDSKYEICDFIYKKEQTEKRPIMIYIHGGGWVSGVKNMRRPYCYEFAKDGFFVANLDYDWSPKSIFPVSINQCLKAIDFIYDNAEKYNLDTSRIFLAGESAGAYYVNMLAAIAKDKAILDKIGLTLKHKEFDVTVNLYNCGAIDILSMAKGKFPNMKLFLHSFLDMTPKEIVCPENYKKVQMTNPVTYVKEDFPPTFMLYATHDDLRFDTFKFKEMYDKLGIKNDIYECSGPIYCNHAFGLFTKPKQGQKILKAVKDFVYPYIFN